MPIPDKTADLHGLVVVLVRPRNPLNIGAAARAMSNFGASQLRLVNPYAVAFREARSAVGASELLQKALEYKNVADAVSDCALVVGTTAVRNRALHHPVHTLSAKTAALFREKLASGNVALLFGSEKIGLTNDDFSHCHWLLTIPTQARHISMNHISINLGQAVAVCLYELSRVAVDEPTSQVETPATSGEIEKITESLLAALHASGYVKPGNDAMCEKKVRELVIRFGLGAIDAKVLLGIVRQIAWKLRQS